MATVWLIHGLWAIAAILWAELTRDSYHALAHLWPALYRWHHWHHRVFRQDFTPTSATIYQQAHWYHDVPEAIVMLGSSGSFWLLSHYWNPEQQIYSLIGVLYTLSFLLPAIGRGLGIPRVDQLTDLAHLPGDFLTPPTPWFVNRPYHWRHHFDNQNAYFCGTLTVFDKLMGTALSLKGKTVAVTGASGTLGRSLLLHLHRAGAKVIALTSQTQPITLRIQGEALPVQTITWQVGQEEELASLLEQVDILVLNHGINVHGERTAARSPNPMR